MSKMKLNPIVLFGDDLCTFILEITAEMYQVHTLVVLQLKWLEILCNDFWAVWKKWNFHIETVQKFVDEAAAL